MTHTIDLPDELFARLQKHAVPLIDTPLTIIERALVALEAGDEEVASARPKSGARSFNPAAAPNLAHTTPQKVVVAGKQLPKGHSYWNPLMYAVILEAAARGVGKDDLLELITINRVNGRKEDQGYRYLDAVGISVQGQDANAAWKQAYRVASSIGIAIEVVFAWQDTEKAAMPNTLGSFFVEGN